MLKILAMITMVIDHLALAFLPSSSLLYLAGRLIGRIAMPIFAYKIACGFIHTSNLKRYAYKILLMTLAAQIPFTLLNNRGNFAAELLTHWNIGLTFLSALGVLYLLTSPREEHSLLRFIMLFILFITASHSDYGIYGLAMVILFYYCITYKTSMLLSTLSIGVLTILYYTLSDPSLAGYMIKMQLPALLAVPLIHYVPDSKVKRGKYFFYIFYPVHMFIIVILQFY